MILDYVKLAYSNLGRRKVRTFLTILGILIGITAVVGLIGLGDGLRIAITSQFGIGSTEVISVQAGGLSGAGPPGTGVVNPLTEDDADAIERLSSVEAVIPRIMETGKLEFNDKIGFGMAMSIPSGEDRDLVYDILELEPERGRLLRDGDSEGVVLGYNFYDDKAGFSKEIRPGNTVLIQDKKFEVIGITKKKGSFIFDNIVSMNEDELKDLYDIDDEVDVIAVKVKDKSIIPKATEDIEKLMRKRRDVKEGEEDFEVQTPDQALGQVEDVLNGVKIFVAIIASISIIIGAIGIVNTMFTSVVERRKEIGIMKSIGARNSHVFVLFLIESGLLGFVGGLIGTIIGTGISFLGTLGINNWVGSAATPSVDFMLIFGALLGSFLIGSASGIIPAMRAANLNPVDALRK